MRIYHYHPATGEFTGDGDADPNPLEKGKYLVPANATRRKAPKYIDGKVRVFDGNKWAYRAAPAAPVAEPVADAEPTPEMKAGAVRSRRNALLRASDWRLLPDVLETLPGERVLAIMQYRKALRDVPGQPGFPDEINWPALAD